MYEMIKHNVELMTFLASLMHSEIEGFSSSTKSTIKSHFYENLGKIHSFTERLQKDCRNNSIAHLSFDSSILHQWNSVLCIVGIASFKSISNFN